MAPAAASAGMDIPPPAALQRLLDGPPRWFGPGEVLALTEALAAQLRELLPDPSAACYRAIPRGGIFVLGHLAYALDLPARCLEGAARGRPVVLVDDAVYSGARLRRALRSVRRPVIVAHLCSTPQLRQAVSAHEPNVLACLSAVDLLDETQQRIPDEAARAAWQQSCGARWGRDRYWTGICERVAFPWSEPDAPFWTPDGRALSGWRWVPAEACLRNRYELLGPGDHDLTGQYRPGSGVAYLIQPAGFYLYLPATGEVVGLSDSSALIWRQLAGGSPLSAVIKRLMATFDVSESRAASDTRRALTGFLERGLLRGPAEG